MMKSLKAGFTLAEVLVTLMVIGVVAAMTIPTLMTNTGDKQDQVAAKKVASVLSQGVQLLVAKEISCNASNDETKNADYLASCMLNVISGSKSSSNANEITTNDGMILRFYAPTSSKWTGITSCGSGSFGTGSAAWHGAGSCVVVADVNGSSKGTKNASFPETSTFDAATGFATNPQKGSDIVAFSLNADGARPLAYGDDVDPAYKAIYGSSPATSSLYTTNVWCAISGDKNTGDNYGVTGSETCATSPCAKTGKWQSVPSSECAADSQLASSVVMCNTCAVAAP